MGYTSGSGGLDDAQGPLHHAADAFDMAIQHLNEIAQESSNPAVHSGVARLTSVLDSLREAHGHSGGFEGTFGSYLTQIGVEGVSAASARTASPIPAKPSSAKKSVKTTVDIYGHIVPAAWAGR